MRVNRRFLYAGVFLVALGGVLVAADQGIIDTATLSDALRWWPVALIAVGVGIAVRRTQLSLASGMLAAALPGLVLGGAFAVAPRLGRDCGGSGQSLPGATPEGAAPGPPQGSV